ncbi:MAG: hypothetical protein COA43_00935 [Robiginitomaculum sp.]|nr:MAG: hypothetical protein COA43_00935 [Robiginitomaculum sp.]
MKLISKTQITLALLGSTALMSQVAIAAELDEIVVTATKRSVNIQSVPISVTAITSEQLDDFEISAIKDLAVLTPGLQMAQRSSTWTPYIRGIGTQETAAGTEAGVSTYIDGVYLSSPWGASLAFNNIERVEVLKGPQGTLFGRNATGGLVHIITRDPQQETLVKGKVGYGNYDTAIAQLYATTGLSENLSADIAINYRKQSKGFGTNVTTGERLDGDKDFGIRSKFLFEKGDVRLTLAGDYSKHDSAQGDNRALRPGSITPIIPGVLEFGALPGFQDVQLDTNPLSQTENFGGSLTFELARNNFDFKSISAYREARNDSLFDNDGIPIPLVSVLANVDVDTFTQEVQLTSNSNERLHWIVGAFYMKDDNGYSEPRGLNIYGGAFAPAGIGGQGLIHRVATNSISAYGELAYDLSDATTLTGGLRYTRDKKTLSGVTDIYAADESLIATIPTPEVSEVWSEPTWRLVLSHEIDDNRMVYASYNRGFRSGAYNTVSITGVPVDPEIADAFEVGFKSDLLDNRLRFNTAAYYTDYSGLQIAVTRGINTLLLNAGSAKIYGLEVEGQFAATDDLTLVFGLNLMNTEYSEFAAQVGCTDQVGGITIGIVCDPQGNELQRAPATTFNLGFNYEKTVSFGTIGASANYYFSDEFFWEFDNRVKEDSYGVLNGRISWRNKNDSYGISAYARNLTDTEYASFFVAQASLNDQFTAAPPRTYGIELNFNF